MTTVVTFLSKYFSRANENRNSEKIEIRIEGIKVNKEKKVIYFLFEVIPSLSMSDLIDFLISKKMETNNKIKRIILETNKYWRFSWFKSIKLLSIKVKNVKNPTNRVIINSMIINIFFFKNSLTI